MALTLTSGRAIQGALIARAREVETREQAQALRGLRLHVTRTSLPDPDEDEFYLTDLIGLQARSPDGAVLGFVKSALDVAVEVRVSEGWMAIARPPETAV